MTISRISNPRFILILITLFAALQISACSTEDFANAVADTIVSPASSLAETPNNSDPNLNPSPELPISAPAPTPIAAVAMYSYNADLSAAQPLSGAVLDQSTVYMYFDNASQYSRMNFYCCKGVNGASTGEPHSAAVSDSSVPFVYSVDISQFATTGTRELYVDATRADGSGIESYVVNFSLNITNAPVPPAPGPTADVNLSWVAPSEREDNTAISLSEITGYKIYYGTTQGNYANSVSVNDGTATDYTFSNFSAGTYYFVITTRDVDGRESQYSTEVIIAI